METLLVIHMLVGIALGLTFRAPVVILASTAALPLSAFWPGVAPLGIFEQAAYVVGAVMLMQAGYLWGCAALAEAVHLRRATVRA